MRDDGVRWALVAFPLSLEHTHPMIIAITEDVAVSAVNRGWVLLGLDSDVLTAEANVPPAFSNTPRRTINPGADWS